jgi:hypothetical protein
MASSETAKPATAIAVNGLRIVEQLGGPLDLTDSKIRERLQVAKLIRRFAISTATADIIAELAFVAGCSR